MSDNAKDQAHAQASSIAAMVAALNVDYDRLEELRDEKANLEANILDADDSNKQEAWNVAQDALLEWRKEYAEELVELEEAAGDCKDSDEAREAIEQDALEVQIRSGWGNTGETLEASEFYILLCTGGPAVRIMGELDGNMQPCRAWIEYQDWGTGWEQLWDVDQDTLLTYCQQFYFGE